MRLVAFFCAVRRSGEPPFLSAKLSYSRELRVDGRWNTVTFYGHMSQMRAEESRRVRI